MTCTHIELVLLFAVDVAGLWRRSCPLQQAGKHALILGLLRHLLVAVIIAGSIIIITRVSTLIAVTPTLPALPTLRLA